MSGGLVSLVAELVLVVDPSVVLVVDSVVELLSVTVPVVVGVPPVDEPSSMPVDGSDVTDVIAPPVT